MKLNDFSFHETTIVSFHKENEDVVLYIEDAIAYDELFNITLTAYSVESINNGDTEIIGNDFMICNDGEILNIIIKNNLIEIIIEWVNFKENFYKTLFYRIKCKKVTLTILEGESNNLEIEI